MLFAKRLQFKDIRASFNNLFNELRDEAILPDAALEKWNELTNRVHQLEVQLERAGVNTAINPATISGIPPVDQDKMSALLGSGDYGFRLSMLADNFNYPQPPIVLQFPPIAAISPAMPSQTADSLSTIVTQAQTHINAFIDQLPTNVDSGTRQGFREIFNSLHRMQLQLSLLPPFLLATQWDSIERSLSTYLLLLGSKKIDPAKGKKLLQTIQALSQQFKEEASG